MTILLVDAEPALPDLGKIYYIPNVMENLLSILSVPELRHCTGKNNYECSIPFYGDRRPRLIDLVRRPDKKIPTHYGEIKQLPVGILITEINAWPEGKKRVMLAKASPLYTSDGVLAGVI